jgi:uncharacterized protein RhaS with RHS repeats
MVTTTSFAANGAVTYTYDALGRLVSMSYDNNVLVYYIYDANGNRLKQGINSVTAPLCWTTNNWGEGLWNLSGPCS